MKKKLTLIFALFLVIVTSISAQRNEIAITGGAAYYLGDINPGKHFSLVNPGGGLTFRHNLDPRWTFKTSALYMKLYSDDAKIKFNENRNLSFYSQVFEVAGIGEFNFFPYIIGSRKYPFTPFIFGGVSLFKFNPKAYYQGVAYELQPLGTEGQGTSLYPDREPYSLVAPAIPFGFGFKANITSKFGLVAEWGLRKTFTDYLDDISRTYADPIVLSAENTTMSQILADRSIKTTGDRLVNTGYQRGNSKNKDWFSYAGLSITYKITRQKTCSCYKKYNRHFKYSFD